MSTESAQQFVFTWNIRNFSFCFQKNGERLESLIFKVECFGENQWCLIMYPRGSRKENEQFISLFLQMKTHSVYSEENTMSYEINMALTNKTISEIVKIENHTFKRNESFGWPQFIKLDKVLEELKSSQEDILTIRCRMFGKCRSSLQRETYTDIGIDRCSFLWNIKIPDTSDDVVSKILSFHSQSDYEITLSIPDDSVNICIVQKEESVSPKVISCKISVLNSKGKEVLSKTARYLFEKNNENNVWKFPNIATKSFLKNSTNDLIENNMISLLFEFAATNGNISITEFDPNCGSAPNVDTFSTLHEELKSMLLNNVHSDVILKADGEKVHVHKSVLAARSPIFAAMFSQDMIESQTSVVEISDVEEDILKTFMEFIYTATVDQMDYEKAKKLLFVADKYQVLTLKEKCASFLENALSVRNVCDILTAADMVCHEHLKKIAMNFVILNSVKIFNTTKWFDLIEKNVKLASEIFSNIATNFNIVPKTM